MDVMDATERGASGARWILVLQDSASGLLAAAPLVDLSGDTAAAAFKQVWLGPYPRPLRVITDNGTNLAQGRMKELFERHGIQLATTEPGRAQGNGRAERAVQTLKGLLTASRRTDARPWDEQLADAVKAYNAAPQASLGYAPAHIAFGVVPQLLGVADQGARRLALGLAPRTTEDHMVQREAIREAAADNMLKAQAHQKAYFDRRRRVIRFMPGSLVRRLRKPVGKNKGHKFEAPWDGPYIVVEEKRPDVYRLQNRDTGKILPRTVNVEWLAPFLERERSLPVPPPGRQGPIRGTFDSGDDTDETMVDIGGSHRQRPDQIGEEGVDDAASMTTVSEDLEPQPLTQEEVEVEVSDQPEPEDPDARPDARSVLEDPAEQLHAQESPDAHSDTQEVPGGDAQGQPERETRETQSDEPVTAEPNQAEPEEQPLRRSARLADKRERGGLRLPFLMVPSVRRILQRVGMM
jgi:hypothetical protein